MLLKLANLIYRKMDLASSHDVVQEGVHSVELMGKKTPTAHRCQALLAVTVAVLITVDNHTFNCDMFHQMSGRESF